MALQQLFEGTIDVVGDVHGEIGPLRQLLKQLGDDEAGRHPKGRRLVFVGDLGDRGPNSPAVIELVRALVAQQELAPAARDRARRVRLADEQAASADFARGSHESSGVRFVYRAMPRSVPVI